MMTTKKETAVKKPKSKKPTKKQKEFAKAYIKNGGNGAAAARTVYGSSKQASSIASRNLKKPVVQETLRAELQRSGIDLPTALKPISKALFATKRNDSGEIVDDLDMQLKGSDRALKLLLPDKKESGVNVNLNIDAAHFGGEFVIDAKEVSNE